MSRRLVGLAVPAAALAFIAAGVVLRYFDLEAGNLVWTAGLVLTGFPVVLRTIRGLLRGQFAADIVASLAIVTALLVNSPFPGLIVVLMQTGGEALERHAEGRASRAVRELEAAAPTRAPGWTAIRLRTSRWTRLGPEISSSCGRESWSPATAASSPVSRRWMRPG